MKAFFLKKILAKLHLILLVNKIPLNNNMFLYLSMIHQNFCDQNSSLKIILFDILYIQVILNYQGVLLELQILYLFRESPYCIYLTSSTRIFFTLPIYISNHLFSV